MTTKQRIGLLTSGGDCSGLNAASRAVVHRAVMGYDWDVIGIENGTLGLLQRPVGARPLTTADFNGTLMRQSGTFLGSTNTNNPFAFAMPDRSIRDRSSEIVEGMSELGLDGLIGIGEDGETYNINADTVAGAIASSINARKLIILTDVKGVLDDNGNLIAQLNIDLAKKLMKENTISEGMIPKIETCLSALDNGTEAVHILDGRIKNALILEVFTEKGIGTKMVP